MKKFYFTAVFCVFALIAFAQHPKDTVYKPKNNDTIRIGSILIIKKNKRSKNDSMTVINEMPKHHSRVNTNYGIVDFGFANFDDNTNFATAGNYIVNRPGAPDVSAADVKLRGGKSINVNIWFFMQKLSLIKQNVNLKYGLGLELNNYHFRSAISFKEGGPLPYSISGRIVNEPFIFRDSISFSKNKLAADYLTVPLMLNFATNHKPGRNGFSISFGVSVGYLYSQRNKQQSKERGKEKNKGDYDLERFKFSYLAELGAGPVRFYGSYSPKSIFERGLNVRPYNIGIRFSNW